MIQVAADGRKQTAWRAGENQRLAVSDVRAAAEAIAGGRALLAFLEVPLECVREAVGRARAAGRPVVLDPAPARPLPDDLLRCVDVIRLAAAEAEVLTGIRVDAAGTARRAAERLLARGAGAVLVEAGSAGNLLLWPGGERILPLLAVATVDTTGAGDACSAALAVRLGAGAALEDAAVFANAVAALATTRRGAQGALPGEDDVRALLSGERFAPAGAGEPGVHGEEGGDGDG